LPVVTKERTDLVEQTVAEYREDLGHLSNVDRQRVSETLNHAYEQLRHKRQALFAKLQRPLAIQLKHGLDPSLYSLRVEWSAATNSLRHTAPQRISCTAI
jgi:hypothetical protein